jgi:hypothetical protein
MVRIRSKLVLEALILVPASAACPSGTHNVKWTGGQQNVSGVQGVSALLTAYNPSPVYELSCFWDMLHKNGSQNNYGQVGWIKLASYQNAYVYCEFNNAGAWARLFYNQQNNSWQLDQPSTIPASIEGYFVTYTPGYLTVQYNNGSPLTFQCPWVPNNLQVYGETHNYGAANAGDRMPGVTANKASATQIMKKVNGSWSWASLTMKKEGWGNYETNANHGFNIWDTRNCN